MFRLTLLLTCFWLLSAPTASAQVGGNEWNYVQNNLAGVSFDLPGGYQQFDTLSMSFYWRELDNVTIEVHYVNSTGAEILPGSQPNDPLQTFVDAAVQVNNAQLLDRENIQIDGRNGVEMELTYADDDGTTKHSFQLYFWYNQRVYAFSVTANPDEENLVTYRNMLFDSIEFH